MSHTHRYAELSEARWSYSESLEKTSLMGGLNYGAPRDSRVLAKYEPYTSLCRVERSETELFGISRKNLPSERLKYGAPREIRTPDLLVRSQTLYPAELWAQIIFSCQPLHQPDRVFHFRYVRLASNRQLSYGQLSISFTELLYPLKIFKQVINIEKLLTNSYKIWYNFFCSS